MGHDNTPPPFIFPENFTDSYRTQEYTSRDYRDFEPVLWIRICMDPQVASRIRIRIRMKVVSSIRIRIRIKVMRIRNTASS